MSPDAFFDLLENQKQKLKTAFTTATTQLTTTTTTTHLTTNQSSETTFLALSISCGLMAVIIVVCFTINSYICKYKRS